MSNKYLPIREKCFFERHVLEVAKDLIGKLFVFNGVCGIITETEGYRGKDDEASHAHKGMTLRNKAMFGPPGRLYIYFIYGMYYCMNIVTEHEGQPSAVLIRGLVLPDINLNGPGKICKFLGINNEHYGLNLLNHPTVYVAHGLECPSVTITPRIGISKAQDKLWRFVHNDLTASKIWLHKKTF